MRIVVLLSLLAGCGGPQSPACRDDQNMIGGKCIDSRRVQPDIAADEVQPGAINNDPARLCLYGYDEVKEECLDMPTDLERTLSVDVVPVTTTLGVVMSMSHHAGATWSVRITNIGKAPITLSLADSTFRTARGARMGALLGEEDDYVTPAKSGARTFLLTPELLAPMKNDARLWGVMEGGRFELVFSTPSDQFMWIGEFTNSHPVSVEAVDEIEHALGARQAVPRVGSKRVPPSVTPSATYTAPTRSYSPTYSPSCKKGCPCGNACISCSKTCRK